MMDQAPQPRREKRVIMGQQSLPEILTSNRILPERPQPEIIVAAVNKLFKERSTKVAKTAAGAVKLHMYNYLWNNRRASREDFDLEFSRINRLSEAEKSFSSIDNPLPPIGIEVENFAVSPRIIKVITGLGVRMTDEGEHDWNNYEAEVAPHFSYSALTQARIIQELIKLEFLDLEPDRKGIPRSDFGLLSLHLNFAFPKGVNGLKAYPEDAYPLTDMLALAYSSTERLKSRKTRDSVKIKDKAQKSTKNPNTSPKSRTRLEVRTLEVRDYTTFRLLIEAQRLAAMYFSFLRSKNPKLLADERLTRLWHVFRREALEIRVRYGLVENAVDSIPDHQIQDFLDSKKGLVSDCRALITKYSKMVGEVINEKQ